jgi:hypothetical protein
VTLIVTLIGQLMSDGNLMGYLPERWFRSIPNKKGEPEGSPKGKV